MGTFLVSTTREHKFITSYGLFIILALSVDRIDEPCCDTPLYHNWNNSQETFPRLL